ncbi:MAG: guanylate kinase [Gemmatimonadetes bacterium]|nr:MAG: guanylate kinase [Gemmatimonadota bacterium]
MTPRVVVLAAPSGGGKTTIARELRTRLPALFGYSVSATTRKARPGEQDGEAYHFLTRDEFLRRREAGEFLEWAPYAGELYGTLRHEVERVLASGKHALLDVEVQGARQVRQAYPSPASLIVFVIPPSPTQEVETARRELATVYDRVLVNDDLDTAVNEVIELVRQPDVARPAADGMANTLMSFVQELEREAEQLRYSTRRSR